MSFKDMRDNLKTNNLKNVLALAARFGGVITASVVAYFLSIKIKDAKKVLERFVKEGEARRFITSEGTFYDIPSSRIYLMPFDKKIITCLIKKGGKCKRDLLFQQSMTLTLESFDEVMKRLERKGIVVYDVVSGTYFLREPSLETLKNIKFITSFNYYTDSSENFKIEFEIRKQAEKLKYLMESIREELKDPKIESIFFDPFKYNNINYESKLLVENIIKLLRKKYPFFSYFDLITPFQAKFVKIEEFEGKHGAMFDLSGGNFIKSILALALSDEIEKELNKPVFKMVCELLKSSKCIIDVQEHTDLNRVLLRRAIDFLQINGLIQDTSDGKLKIESKPDIYITCPRCKSVMIGYDDKCPNCHFNTRWLITANEPKERSFIVKDENINEWTAYFIISHLGAIYYEYQLTSKESIIYFPGCAVEVIGDMFKETYFDDLYYFRNYAHLPMEVRGKLDYRIGLCYKVEGSKSSIIAKLDTAIEEIYKIIRLKYKEEVVKKRGEIDAKQKILISMEEFVELAFEKEMLYLLPRLDRHPIRFV